jgi:hypothetical protein
LAQVLELRPAALLLNSSREAPDVHRNFPPDRDRVCPARLTQLPHPPSLFRTFLPVES